MYILLTTALLAAPSDLSAGAGVGTTVPLLERQVLIEDVLQGIPGDPPVRSASSPPGIRAFVEYELSERWHLTLGGAWARRTRRFDSDSFLSNTGLPVATGRSVTKVGQLLVGARYVFFQRPWLELSTVGGLVGARSRASAEGATRLTTFTRDLVPTAFARADAWSVGATLGLMAEHRLTDWFVVRIRGDVLLYSRSRVKARVTDEFVGAEATLPRRDRGNVDLVPRPALEGRFVF